SIAQLFCNRLQTADVFLETIEKNEVVAATMHLGEGNFHLAYSFRVPKSPGLRPPSLQMGRMGDFALLTVDVRLVHWSTAGMTSPYIKPSIFPPPGFTKFLSPPTRPPGGLGCKL